MPRGRKRRPDELELSPGREAPAEGSVRDSRADALLRVQQTAGNAAVQRMVRDGLAGPQTLSRFPRFDGLLDDLKLPSKAAASKVAPPASKTPTKVSGGGGGIFGGLASSVANAASAASKLPPAPTESKLPAKTSSGGGGGMLGGIASSMASAAAAASAVSKAPSTSNVWGEAGTAEDEWEGNVW